MTLRYEDAINDKETFAKKLYLARIGKSMLPRGDTGFSKLWQKVKEQSNRPPSYLVSQLTPSDPIPEEIKVAAESDLSTPLPKKEKKVLDMVIAVVIFLVQKLSLIYHG